MADRVSTLPPAGTELPAGTVTFLMTDVEGSTRLWDEHPDGMPQAIALHDALLDEHVARHRGHLIKTRGEADGGFAVFREARDAVSCALVLQRTFLDQEWPEGIPLRVRMALHTGEAELRGGDYYGPAVNRCARIRAIAYGQQVILSATTYHLARQDRLPDLVLLKDLGSHRLKDLDQPEQVWQVVYPGLPDEFPPLKSLTMVSNNLPVQLTSFVGREREVAEIKELLRSTRLLTVAGAGGLGKTRLALHVAEDLLDEFTNGVWLVEFGSLSDPALVVRQVAQAVGVREEAGQTLLETLVDHLRPRTLLFVFDNCEHLTEACAEVASHLLRMCPHLTIVATSRGPLRVEGETVWRIRPLPVPDPKVEDIEALIDLASVQLFLDRARNAMPDFKLTHENASAVARICARLDGVPLAIELAAARVKMLSPTQITERLAQQFELLTGGSRTAPTRQQTLRAAIEWSYDLLSATERLLLQRLSVFAGGFALEAAEEIASDEELDQLEVLDLVSELVDESLLLAEPIDGRVRYRMLESIREFSGEKLSGAGNEDELRQRHLGWYLTLAEEAEPQLESSDQILWLDRLQEEDDNFRQALGWGIGARPTEMGLRLAGSLRRFWHMRGFLTEGREWLDRALSNCPHAPEEVQAKAFNGAGILSAVQGDFQRARFLYERALEILRRLDDQEGLADVLGNLGGIAQSLGDYEQARALHDDSLRIRRGIADKSGIADSLNALGTLARFQGDYPTARSLYRESLSIRRDLGDLQAIAGSLYSLGTVAWLEGDYESARESFEETLTIRRQLGSKPGVATSLDTLGSVAWIRGDYARARELYEESRQIRDELGDRPGLAGSLNNLGNVAWAQAEYESARSLYQDSLGIRRELGEKRGIADSLNNLGTVTQALGELDAARRLFEESLEIRRELGSRTGIAESLSNLGRVALEEESFERADDLLRQSLELQRELGDQQGVGDSLTSLGRVAARRGEMAGARALLLEAHTILSELGDKRGLAECLEGLASVVGAGGDAVLAVRLFGRAAALREEIGSPLSPSARQAYERDVSAVRAGIGEEEFQREWSKGRTMSTREITSLIELG